MPKVFVIVLNYNGKETLTPCLKSVFQMNYSDFEVVVVDNNSKDGSLEEAKSLFSRAHFITNEANIGFSAGNNIAIRFALEKGADYIWLLNNDAIVEKNTLSTLVDEGEKKNSAGILSPLILHAETKNIWFGKGEISWKQMRTRHISPPTLLQPYTSEYICGCAMLIKKEVFKKIGLLEEKYFLYYEDADFSIRASRSGFELWIIPSAQIFHHEASSKNPQKLYWLVVSGLQFFHTQSPTCAKPWITLYTLARRIKNKIDLFSRPTEETKEVARAYHDYFKKK